MSLGPKFGPRVSTCEPWPPNVRLCSDRPAPPSGQWLINKARPSADPHNSSNQLSMASSITGHCCNYSLDCRPCHRQCWYFIGPPGAGQLRRLYRYIFYIYLYTEYWFYYSWLGLQKINFSLSDCDLGIIFFLTWEKSNCIIKLIYNGPFKVILTKCSKYNILGFWKALTKLQAKIRL